MEWLYRLASVDWPNLLRRMAKPALLLILAFWAWGLYAPFRFARYGIVDTDPIRTETDAKPFAFESFGLLPRIFVIHPRTTYDITGRVLHTRQYFTHGFFGDILPFDFALGWKGMSDLDILRPYMRFDHRGVKGIGRYYSFKYHWDENTPPDYIPVMASTSIKSNNHLIPADFSTFMKLWRVGTGDIVHLKGYLVDVTWPDQPDWIWKTALVPSENHATKWDDNNPDCQTMFVTDVTVQ